MNYYGFIVGDDDSSSGQKEDPLGGLAFRVSDHLAKIAASSPAVRREFYPDERERCPLRSGLTDPLEEDRFVKTKGLVHKYPGRVLVLLTMACASYCRFCTRRRSVSEVKEGKLTSRDIDRMVMYLKKTSSVTEVIFSGGDPLMVPDLLAEALVKLSRLSQIKILRIHSRVPVSDPRLVPVGLYSALKKVRQPVYFSIHFEHPDELTPATVKVIGRLRASGAILLSQSVFLKGINDSYPVLLKLFTRLAELGVRPYYIFRCDPVKGAMHFIVPPEREVAIMTKLRRHLSGIAWPTYVIDAPNGSGKVPVPLDFWDFDKRFFRDFDGRRIPVKD